MKEPIKLHQDSIHECDACGFTTMCTNYERSGLTAIKDGRTKWLCELCSHTATGTSLDYPNQFPNRRVLETICYVGNVIISKVRSRLKMNKREWVIPIFMGTVMGLVIIILIIIIEKLIKV